VSRGFSLCVFFIFNTFISLANATQSLSLSIFRIVTSLVFWFFY